LEFLLFFYIAKSPADGTPRRPVLSVSARKIKDNAADWHNLMMKWERMNDNGFATASKIVNMKINKKVVTAIILKNPTTTKPTLVELSSCCKEKPITNRVLRRNFSRVLTAEQGLSDRVLTGTSSGIFCCNSVRCCFCSLATPSPLTEFTAAVGKSARQGRCVHLSCFGFTVKWLGLNCAER
uniref:CINP protein n=1 Tax=Strix occidentalis caurina TaxID=311401 RepID=A0A8D0ER04_STROC